MTTPTPPVALSLFEQPSSADMRFAATLVDSHPVVSAYASCEWDELDDDGKVWIAALVREARRTAPAAMRAALEAARAKFAFYREEHRNKAGKFAMTNGAHSPECLASLEKAAVNEEMAEMMDRALSAPTEAGIGAGEDATEVSTSAPVYTEGAVGFKVPAGAGEGWDHRYRMLAAGEIIEASDEGRRDDGTWVTGVCVGEPAPDPAYTSHRVYRRLVAPSASSACPICEKATPHAHGPEVVQAWRETTETRARQAFSDGAFAMGGAYNIDDPAVEHVIKQAFDPDSYTPKPPAALDEQRAETLAREVLADTMGVDRNATVAHRDFDTITVGSAVKAMVQLQREFATSPRASGEERTCDDPGRSSAIGTVPAPAPRWHRGGAK